MDEPRNRQFNMEDPKTNRATGMTLAIAFAVVLLIALALYLGSLTLGIFE